MQEKHLTRYTITPAPNIADTSVSSFPFTTRMITWPACWLKQGDRVKGESMDTATEVNPGNVEGSKEGPLPERVPYVGAE